jgi:hypothetical protein
LSGAGGQHVKDNQNVHLLDAKRQMVNFILHTLGRTSPAKGTTGRISRI